MNLLHVLLILYKEKKRKAEEERKKKEEQEKKKKEELDKKKKEEQVFDLRDIDSYIQEKQKQQQVATTSNKSQQFRALYDYNPQETNELSFKEGDIINLIEKFPDSEWWKGECKGKVGLFPGNYVEPVQQAQQPSLPAKQEASKQQKARAIYDYAAQETNELSFKEGDIITVVDKITDSDWWMGELNGKKGVFPTNYVEIM